MVDGRPVTWLEVQARIPPFDKRLAPAKKLELLRAAVTRRIDALLVAKAAVSQGLRVESDEATYNLHILLRFELEQALMSGALKADDVPAAWSDTLHGLLGVRPSGDDRGCLQDVHWSGGSLGYFPTYTLGNLFSAQLFEAAGRDLGDLDAAFARGEFAPLREWLRDKVHRHGQRYLPRELITRATGAPPSVEPLLAHLRRVGDQIDRAANRLSMALVIAALIIGSSIVMNVKGGPTLFGLPAFGFMGFIGAVIGGLWLVRSIWRSNHGRTLDDEG